MACRTDNYYEDGTEGQLRKEITSLTQMLCATCGDLESSGLPIPQIARGWWTQHKIDDERHRREDEARAAKARLKAEALAKLSADEREALGLVAR